MYAAAIILEILWRSLCSSTAAALKKTPGIILSDNVYELFRISYKSCLPTPISRIRGAEAYTFYYIS